MLSSDEKSAGSMVAYNSCEELREKVAQVDVCPSDICDSKGD